jgi:octaprenyl-diphosphate synthase
LIHCLQHGSDSQRELIRSAIISGEISRIDEVRNAIESTGSIAYTARRAEEQATLAKQAVALMPGGACKQALMDLADYSVQRSY